MKVLNLWPRLLFTLWIGMLGLAKSGYAQTATYTGIGYSQDSKQSEKLFNLKVEIKPVSDGKTEVVSTYSGLDGKNLVEEKSVLSGSTLLKYSVDHLQTGQKGSVQVADEKVTFSVTKEGKTKTSEEKLGSTLVISGNFGRFIKDHWTDIKAGKEVGFRYVAWQRRETVGFEVFKTGEEKIDGEDCVVVKMKPSSFIISALVKPLVLTYSADGAKILRLNGRVPPMKPSGDSFKDLDAEVVYRYDNPN